MGRSSRWLMVASVFFAALLWQRRAEAYPWMIRHGYFGCSTCHADPSGGGLLTRYGRAQGDLLLRMHYGSTTHVHAQPAQPSGGGFDSFDSFDTSDTQSQSQAAQAKPETQAEPESPPAPVTNPLWGLLKTPSWLLLGGSYRHMTLYKFGQPDPFKTFPMQMDVYGDVRFGWFRADGSIGLAKVPAGSPFARRAQITTNQGNAFNLISRTYWLGAAFDDQTFIARVGRLNLPFGLRIPEHTMWVRNATRTDRESAQQDGVALAYNGENLRGEVMAIAGNYQINPDRFRERGYSGYAEIHVAAPLYLGASSLITHARTDYQTLENNVTRQAHGVFARINPVKPVVVLAEGDALVQSRRNLGYVGFVQLDFEFIQGLHFATTGEVLDAGYEDSGDPYNTTRKIPGFGYPRYGGWLTIDWFFFLQLEARVDLVARQNDPLTLLAQLHAYL